ncbi:MAG: AtpZ/AtpI family protein [Candidatus Rokubacteria bacterium]|nr:AtpZ/AtpI family protein [Candidatus Rokubacteria bacterium]
MAEPSPWRALGVLASAGITFVVATAGGTLLGYFLDLWLVKTKPWLTLIGLGLGIFVGFRELFRSIKAAAREEQNGP